MTAFLVGAAIGAVIIVGLFAVLYLRGVREDREAYPPMPPEEVAAKVEAWRGWSSCSKCRASSADGGPMICDRDGCPGEAARAEREAMQRSERAYDRGAPQDHQADAERRAEWDRGIG